MQQGKGVRNDDYRRRILNGRGRYSCKRGVVLAVGPAGSLGRGQELKVSETSAALVRGSWTFDNIAVLGNPLLGSPEHFRKAGLVVQGTNIGIDLQVGD